MKTLFFFLLFYLCDLCHPLMAQRDCWYDAGFGGYSYSGNQPFTHGIFDGLLVGASVNWKNQNTFYKIRANYGAEIQLMSTRNPNQNIFDLSGLIGKGYTYKHLKMNIFTGLGILTGTTRGEFISREQAMFGNSYYQNKSFISPTIALDCNLILYVSRKFGIGIDCLGGITPQNTFGGLMLKVAIGEIR